MLPEVDVWVDGWFGTGLHRPLAGTAAALVECLAGSTKPVLALDVPSGLDADTGVRTGPTVRAAATVTFVAWKRGLFTADAVDCCGILELADLDLPAAARATVAADVELLDASVGQRLAPRPHNAHKGLFGHVLVVGGDHGMGGAVALAGMAALRVGAGLVSIATRPAHIGALNAARPELMAHACEDPQTLAGRLRDIDVVAMGPGLGQGAWGHALLDTALGDRAPPGERSFVLDADALNLLARQPRP
jgi:NAD(P)H-hydrate epimerase